MKFAVVLLAGCLLSANAHSLRSLLQVEQTTGMQTTGTTGMAGGASSIPPSMEARQVRVEPPATEFELLQFELALTPSSETMSYSGMLSPQLSNPQQFSSWVSQTLQQPDGLTVVAAVFSDLMARGQSQQLVNAIEQSFGSQAGATGGVAAQTGGAGQGVSSTQVYKAYALALVDQISRMNTLRAADGIWWALNSGDQAFSQAVISELDSLQARIGCSDPLRATLREVGNVANAQQGMSTGGTTTGMAGGSSSSFFNAMQNSPSLMACFENAYPNWQSLMGGATGGGAGATGATGTTGAGTSGTGETAGGMAGGTGAGNP